jgi:aminoglycoside phosphotransferase (APT) family kinase protein
MPATLIDHDALRRWLDERGLGRGAPLSVEPLSNGRSNVMLSITRGESRWVLRRPRTVAVDRADGLMRREFRLLKALSGSAVPHAEAVALCEDTSVLGCVFYLMELAEGFNPVGALPAALSGAHEAVASAMIDALVTLHQVDWRAAGLTDFGKPDGFHQRQVSRWLHQLDGYRGRELPELRHVAEWLDRHVPTRFKPTIMHGDYHVLNVIVAPDKPVRVAAIVDWETATIGDPVLDVVGFLEVYDEACAPEQGWPQRSLLWRRYADSIGFGHDLSADYYVALYNFRMAVLTEGIYQRSLRDSTREAAHDVAERVAVNTRRALAAIEEAGRTT